MSRVRELAASVFALAGCSGLARCDFFVEPDGEVLVNEVNTMPGFTETSVYAKLLEASGIAYPDVCNRLVELAVERHGGAVVRVLGTRAPAGGGDTVPAAHRAATPAPRHPPEESPPNSNDPQGPSASSTPGRERKLEAGDTGRLFV